MRITSEILTTPMIQSAAASNGMYLADFNTHRYVRTPDKHSFTMKLRVNDGNEAYRCYNPISGRSCGHHIPCWHGFRDFYAAIYNLDPNAIIETGGMKLPKIVYTSRENFEETHEDTGYINIGSEIYPYNYLDACNH